MTDVSGLRRAIDDQDVKACCTALYEHPLVQFLLGDSFHPGGLALTDRLAELLDIGPESKVLDIASGTGTTAIHLARTSGCSVMGIDLSETNVEISRRAAVDSGLDTRVEFRTGDAERLPCDDAQFDVVICECALCTFPDKSTASREMVRVVKEGGTVGISDVIREGDLPTSLDQVLAMAACIADARSGSGYVALLEGAGLTVTTTERHDEAVRVLLDQIRTQLIGAQLLVGTGTIELPGFDLAEARSILKDAERAMADGLLGYGLIVGVRR